MPFRRRNRSSDLAKKEGPEFDHWLKSNISDSGYRNWYRAELIEKEKWLDKLASQISNYKSTSH